MRALRTSVVALLVIGLSASAFAGDLKTSIAKAAEQQAQAQSGSIPKAYLWPGMALFVGGMAVGLSAFINNQNGEFSEFGEANAVNKKLGAAGLGAAFVGGTVLFLGAHRSTQAPAVTFGPGRVTLSKQLSW